MLEVQWVMEQEEAALEQELLAVWAMRQREGLSRVPDPLLVEMDLLSGMMNPQQVVADPLSGMMSPQNWQVSSLDDESSRHACPAQSHH